MKRVHNYAPPECKEVDGVSEQGKRTHLMDTAPDLRPRKKRRVRSAKESSGPIYSGPAVSCAEINLGHHSPGAQSENQSGQYSDTNIISLPNAQPETYPTEELGDAIQSKPCKHRDGMFQHLLMLSLSMMSNKILIALYRILFSNTKARQI
jgi:hypothetical protein